MHALDNQIRHWLNTSGVASPLATRAGLRFSALASESVVDLGCHVVWSMTVRRWRYEDCGAEEIGCGEGWTSAQKIFWLPRGKWHELVHFV